ncbi:hypothetical protein ACSBR1_016923 [Camellia fascicularis]
MDKVVDEIGEEYVVQIVTDNEAAIKAAGYKLMQKRKNLYWTGCAAHCIDLMLEDIGKKKSVAKVLDCAKVITRFIYNSNWVVDFMKRFTGDRELLRPVITRFATNFITLESIVKHKTALQDMFHSQEWKHSKWSKKDDAKEAKKIIQSKDFWTKAADVLKVQEPLLKPRRPIPDTYRSILPIPILRDRYRYVTRYRDLELWIQAFEEGNGWLYESAIIRFNTEHPTHIISKALKEKGLEQIENRNTLNNIGRTWGSILSLEGDLCQPKSFSHARIRVAIACMEPINRTIILKCNGSSYPILVCEDHLTYSDSLKHNSLEEFSSIGTCYSEAVATVVEESPVVGGYSREKKASVEEPLLEGSDGNSKSNDDNLRCIPQVHTSGFIKHLNEAGDGLGPGINLEVNLAKEFREDIGPGINLEVNLAHSSNKFSDCGPSNRPKELVNNKHGILASLASSIPHMQSAGPNLSAGKSILTPYHSGQFKPLSHNPILQQPMKKRGKKKSQLEGFSSFAKIHGYRAAAVHKHSSKSIIFRPAAFALAHSDLSESSSSFNHCLLQEAKDTMHLGKSLGINFNGMEDVALSKIIDLELKDKERIIKEGKAQQ